MKKTRKILTLILAIMLICSITMLISACVDPKPGDDDKKTEDELIRDMLVKNGTFYSSKNTEGSTNYIKEILTGWSKNSGAISYSDVRMGGLDLAKDKFDANSSAIRDGLKYPTIDPRSPKEPNGSLQDTNAMVIASNDKAGSVYYRTSSSIALEPNKFYQLEMSVYTDLIDASANQGAYIYVVDGVYAEFKAIKTEGKWQTYTVSIMSNNFESRNINIELWLGHGPNYIGTADAANANPRLTKGIALFDNIILKEVTEQDYNDANPSETHVKDSLIFGDQGLTYESKISSTTSSSTSSKAYYSTKSGSANNYSLIAGKSDIENSEDRPDVITGATATNGIFDMSRFYNYNADATEDKDKYKDNFKSINSDFIAPKYSDFMDDENKPFVKGRTNLKEFEALMIFHRKISGAGFKSNQKLMIENDKYYTISVWVYVYKPEYPEKLTLPYPNLIEVTEPTNPGEDATQEEKDKYTKDKAAYDAYLKQKAENDKKQSAYDDDKAAYDAINPSAHFKLTGASINDDTLETQRTTGVDVWQKLTYNIKGNQLSSRYVNLEFWFGEGLKGSDTLMVGGALFDNIEIAISSTETAGVIYNELSPLTADQANMVGLLDEQTDDFKKIDADNKKWTHKFEDEGTSLDSAKVGIVSGKAAKNPELWGAGKLFDGLKMPDTYEIMYNSAKTLYNVLMMQQLKYTASSLTYTNLDDNDTAKYINVLPNNFYRLSMWVRTEGIAEGKGLTVNLLRKNDTDENSDRNVLTSVSNINIEKEWTEVVFYLKGESIKDNNFTIEFQLGSGDLFTTENHVKGTAFVTAITLQDNVTYTEFKNITTNNYTKSYTFTTDSNTDNTVSNGYFAKTDYEATFKADSKAYNDKGQLVGIATPTDWSISTPVTTLNTPKNVKIEGADLIWDEVENANGYEVYLSGFKDEKGVIQKDTLIANVTTNKYSVSVYRAGNFKVRAVHTESKEYGVSAMSVAIKNTLADSSKEQEVNKIDGLEYKFGVIDSKNFADLDKYKGSTDLFPTNDESLEFLSAKSDNLLMLTSNYYTRGGYSMSSSSSLDSNSYYEISVWVKTIGDAKASVTISNLSNIFNNTQYEGALPADGEYVGYVNQSTGDKWVQYRFYAETSVVSTTLKLELGLGNKYAVDEKVYYKEGDEGYDASNPKKVKSTIKKGLSKGTVFFDEISFKKIDTEEAYKLKTEGSVEKPLEENKLIAHEQYKNNQFIFKKLLYTTDSFDVFTPAAEDSQNGGTPKDYTHSRATDGIDTIDSAVYGVFKADELTEEHDYIFNNTTIKEDSANWLPQNFDLAMLKSFMTGEGKNVLFMANFKDNGQYYKSNSKTLNSGTYYKISFLAKTYLPAGKYAEFRFEYGDQTKKYTTIRINSTGRNNDANEFVEYSMYVYNEQTSSISSNKLSFHLGTADADVAKNFFKGLMVIDNVSFQVIEKADFDTATKAYNALSSSDAKLNSTSQFYTFAKKAVPKEDDTTTNKKNPISENIWVLLATAVLGALIVVVLVVYAVRKIKKKATKKSVKPISNVPSNREVMAPKSDKKQDINTNEFDD